MQLSHKKCQLTEQREVYLKFSSRYVVCLYVQQLWPNVFIKYDEILCEVHPNLPNHPNLLQRTNKKCVRIFKDGGCLFKDFA